MLPLIALVVLLRCSATIQTQFCETVSKGCDSKQSWSRCYDRNIRSCRRGRFIDPNFIYEKVNTSQQVKMNLSEHWVHIPVSALQRSLGRGRGRGLYLEDKVLLVITLLNGSHFQSKGPRNLLESHGNNTNKERILGDTVLVVKLGNNSVKNLSQPIQLVFKHNHTADSGKCVFWEDEVAGKEHWSTTGCQTEVIGDGFRCSCDHLSFFAVLVNPKVSLDKATALNLSYISIGGSGLSVLCSLLSLIIYTCLQRRRPEKSIGVHMLLTGAILCLHLSFLLGCLWAWLEGGGWACQVFGALLHWSVLGTFTWTAIEGFHLYILLVRVFNVYIKKYLLKLSLVGLGVPTVVAVTCGILGIYGEYRLEVTDSTTKSNTTIKICWIRDEPMVLYGLMLTYLCAVLLFNGAMLGLVVLKLRNLRRTTAGFHSGVTSGSNAKWKPMDKEKRSRLLKDLATVLGLSCVLGLAWSLSFTTYSSVSPAGLYLFTILNSLQGVFMFLWSLALTCKARSENGSSAQYTSTIKKMTETSFNS